MKATVDDLKRYAYCPKFFEQEGPLFSQNESTADFTKLLTYLFRRDMETETKQSWKSTEKRWRKIFFSRISEEPTDEDLKAFNRSLVPVKKFYDWYLKQPTAVAAVNYTLSASVYDHQIICDAPVLIMGEEGLTVITTEPLVSLNAVMLNPAVRYLAMALDEELSVDKVQNVSLIDYQVFHVEEFSPTDRYYELAVMDFVGLMTSMQSQLTYPNTVGCNTCPIFMTCKAMKGYDT